VALRGANVCAGFEGLVRSRVGQELIGARLARKRADISGDCSFEDAAEVEPSGNAQAPARPSSLRPTGNNPARSLARPERMLVASDRTARIDFQRPLRLLPWISVGRTPVISMCVQERRNLRQKPTAGQTLETIHIRRCRGCKRVAILCLRVHRRARVASRTVHNEWGRRSERRSPTRCCRIPPGLQELGRRTC
jgi:hypothetical protein